MLRIYSPNEATSPRRCKGLGSLPLLIVFFCFCVCVCVRFRFRLLAGPSRHLLLRPHVRALVVLGI